MGFIESFKEGYYNGEEIKREQSKQLKITGIKIPFFDLVWFLVQIALAAIPAALIVGFIAYFVLQVLAAV